jgi:hypothetical protein
VRNIGFTSGISSSERRVAVGGWIGLPGRQTTVAFARDLGGLGIYIFEIFQHKADRIVQAVQIQPMKGYTRCRLLGGVIAAQPINERSYFIIAPQIGKREKAVHSDGRYSRCRT